MWKELERRRHLLAFARAVRGHRYAASESWHVDGERLGPEVDGNEDALGALGAFEDKTLGRNAIHGQIRPGSESRRAPPQRQQPAIEVEMRIRIQKLGSDIPNGVVAPNG